MAAGRGRLFEGRMSLSAGPWQLLATLLISLLLLVGCAEGKVLRGEVSSRSAWENKGVFLAKFGFHGGYIACRAHP